MPTRALRSLAMAVLLLAAAVATAVAPVSAESGRPGDFDYYALVLSWSPTYCADRGTSRNDPQCSSSRPYAFVMHGL